MDTPFYKLVPKDLLRNIAWRRKLLDYGAKSKANALDIWIACKRDALFWLSSFGVLQEPRAKGKDSSKKLLFIPYPFQEDAFGQIYDSIVEGKDLVIVKSRDMGATWMCLMAILHRWWFFEDETFLILSRKEELVEKRGDSKALFSKLDFVLEHAPGWLKPPIRPNYERTKMHLGNPNTGSSIDGESTNEFAGVADRRTAILADEFSKMPDQGAILTGTRDVTECRIFNFTPEDDTSASYEIAHNSDFQQMRLHWPMHPVKAAGLYVGTDGKPRSPWYDFQCKRSANVREIAKELDMNFMGAACAFFDPKTIDSVIARYARRPDLRGRLIYDATTGWDARFEESENGNLLLWTYLDQDGCPPPDRYGIACDIGFGTADMHGRGASNSVAAVVNKVTREKVCEFATSSLSPDEFGSFVAALSRWFCDLEGEGAEVIWEANGPGRLFGKRLIDLGVRNIWFRERAESIGKEKTRIPGFWTSRDNKQVLLGDYARQLKCFGYINRSEAALNECRQYIISPTGIVGHSRSLATDDPTKARDNHGDRVIADALVIILIGDVVTEKPAEQPRSEYCFDRRYRMAMAEADEKAGGGWEP